MYICADQSLYCQSNKYLVIAKSNLPRHAYILVVVPEILQRATRMATFGTLQEYRPDEEGIAAYLERVELYFTANDVAEAKRVPVFLSVVGGKVYSLLRDLLAPAKPDSKTFAVLTATLTSHYEQASCAKRVKFNNYSALLSNDNRHH